MEIRTHLRALERGFSATETVCKCNCEINNYLCKTVLTTCMYSKLERGFSTT